MISFDSENSQQNFEIYQETCVSKPGNSSRQRFLKKLFRFLFLFSLHATQGQWEPVNCKQSFGSPYYLISWIQKAAVSNNNTTSQPPLASLAQEFQSLARHALLHWCHDWWGRFKPPGFGIKTPSNFSSWECQLLEKVQKLKGQRKGSKIVSLKVSLCCAHMVMWQNQFQKFE